MSDDKPWLFKKGQSGNPKGGNLPPDIRRCRRFNKVEFERIVNKLMYCTRGEIKAIGENPKSEVIELAICKVLMEATNKGDPKRLDFIFNRVLGKPRETVDLHFPTDHDPIEDMTDEEIEAELKNHGIE